MPLVKTLSKPFRDPSFRLQSRRPRLTTIALLAITGWLLFYLPLPNTYTTAGVAWPKESERLYSEESGFVSEVKLPINESREEAVGYKVAAHQQLLTLTHYELHDRARALEAQLAEAKARLRSVYQDRSQANLASAELVRFQNEKVEIEDALARTQVQARIAGQAVIQQAGQLDKRYLQRGEVIGYVLNQDLPLTVKVPIAETEAERVLGQVLSVTVRRASSRGQVWPAQLSVVEPRVGKDVPSVVLTTMGGGDIVLDPSAGDDLTALENYMLLDVEVLGQSMDYVFERVFVRFDLPPEPLATRLYRQIRQVFIEKFDV